MAKLARIDRQVDDQQFGDPFQVGRVNAGEARSNRGGKGHGAPRDQRRNAAGPGTIRPRVMRKSITSGASRWAISRGPANIAGLSP